MQSFMKRIQGHYKVVAVSPQGFFNEEAISMLPKIADVIKTAPKFEANQMKNKALQEIGNSHKPISEMSDSEKVEFSDKLLKMFKSKNWL